MSTRRCGTAAESSPGTDAWTGERVPRDGHPRRRPWRSSPWLQKLQGSLEHAPAASACSAECCALPAARRSRAVDIVDIFLQRIDGNRKRLEEASGSARASTGCNHRPSGTSGGPCGPAGAIGGVCTHVEGRWTVVTFTVLRMSMYVVCMRALAEPGSVHSRDHPEMFYRGARNLSMSDIHHRPRKHDASETGVKGYRRGT